MRAVSWFYDGGEEVLGAVFQPYGVGAAGAVGVGDGSGGCGVPGEGLPDVFVHGTSIQ